MSKPTRKSCEVISWKVRRSSFQPPRLQERGWAWRSSDGELALVSYESKLYVYITSWWNIFYIYIYILIYIIMYIICESFSGTCWTTSIRLSGDQSRPHLSDLAQGPNNQELSRKRFERGNAIQLWRWGHHPGLLRVVPSFTYWVFGRGDHIFGFLEDKELLGLPVGSYRTYTGSGASWLKLPWS